MSTGVTVFLYYLAFVGAWNLVNMIARILCGEPWWLYWFHVFVGAWAAGLLIGAAW